MRKLLPLAVALSATFAMTGAHADVILIDSFNGPYAPPTEQYIQENTAASVGTYLSSSTFNPSLTGGGDMSYATSRTLAVDCTVGTGSAVAPCVAGFAGIAQSGGAGPNGNNNLEFDVRNNMKAATRVTWILPPNPNLVSPSSFFFQIISNTTGSPGNTPTNIDFRFNGLSDGNATPGNDFDLINQDFGSVAGVPATFALTPAQVNSLKVGGTLVADLTNPGAGWSIQLDQFGLFTPEPTSLALAGLALVGAGLASRRRKG